MKRFAYGILAGVAAVFGSLVAAYVAVAQFWPASMPPPAISPLVHLDEKLRFLRRHPGLDPRILAVGSSVTWRQLDGSAFERSGHNPPLFLNGATAQLQVHQTRELIELYLGHYPHVRTVIVMTGLPDFADCTTEPASLLDREDAAAYAFEHWPAAYFYLRYFSPQRYVSTALRLAKRQTPFTGDLFLDRYGSGPVVVPESRDLGLRYNAIRPDPACISALVDLSREITARGLRLVLVFPPVHPDYRRKYVTVTDQLRAIARRVAAATANHNTSVLKMIDHPGFAAEDFYDAFHLQWPSAGRLSELVARTIQGVTTVEATDAHAAHRQRGSTAPGL